MPDGLPPQFWDSQGGKVNMPELLKSYGEATAFKTQHETSLSELAKRKPEDIKIELKLPDTIKVPEGVDLKIDEKDPRIAPLRDLAIKHHLPQDVINELVALDAQVRLADYTSADAQLQAEQKKLGENGKARVSAVESYLKANVTPEEYEEMRPFIGNATAFAGIEKLIAKATTQLVPGPKPPEQQKTAPVSIEQRWYGNGNSQQKAS